MTVTSLSDYRAAAFKTATERELVYTDGPAAIVPLPPTARTPAVRDVVDEMAAFKVQKPARAALREALKVRAKQLRALGVDQDAIAQDALAFARTVRAQLSARRRIAGAAEQIEHKIAARIGERRAATTAPLPAMPRPAPPEPHFRIRWPAKVSLHPTFQDRRAVDRHVDGLMRMSADGAERHILRNLDAIGRLLQGMGIEDETTITAFTRDFESRARAAYWHRVLLSDLPPPKGTTAP